MKIFICAFLQLAAMVASAPIRVQRDHVLSFPSDALDATTTKTISATPTELPEAKSGEGLDTNGAKDAAKDPDSYEARGNKVVGKNLSKRKSTGVVNKQNTGLLDVQDHGSREILGPVQEHQASREQIDLNSQEGVTATARNVDFLSGKQVVWLSGEQVGDTASQGQRKAAPGGVKRMLIPGERRVVQDPDSLEENNRRPAQMGNRGPAADYDETRELFSSETNPIGTPDRMPSGSSVLS